MNYKLILILVLSFLHRGYAQNYDESKVPAYTLPDVLLTTRNQVVSDKLTWERYRRPEVLAFFRNDVYGQMTHTYEDLEFIFTNMASGAMNGKATLKEADITVKKVGKSVKIHLVYFIPNNRKGPVPVFLLINNRDKKNTDPARNEKSEFWPAEAIIDSGFAVAAFHVNDVAPDDKDQYKNGAIQLYPEQEKVPNGMKAIGAWAWGASRVLDYFEQEPDINARKVFVVGHSRGGKAALWAGAVDERFAMVFSNCSGNSGAALSRRKFGETIKMINDRFPHWFTDNYKKYNDNEEALPVDQHMLISLIAPRPVYVTSATKDLWADPLGMYLALYHGQAAYNLYGIPKIPAEPPAVSVPLHAKAIGYHMREGVHDMTLYDWNNFIQFAKMNLGN